MKPDPRLTPFRLQIRDMGEYVHFIYAANNDLSPSGLDHQDPIIVMMVRQAALVLDEQFYADLQRALWEHIRRLALTVGIDIGEPVIATPPEGEMPV